MSSFTRGVAKHWTDAFLLRLFGEGRGSELPQLCGNPQRV